MAPSDDELASDEEEVDVPEAPRDSCHSSTEGNDSSYDDEGSLSSGDASTGAARTGKRKTPQGFVDDDNDSNRGSGTQALDDLKSRTKSKWTVEQDHQLLVRMQLETQSAGTERVSVPTAVKKELAQSLGQKEEAIVRRWFSLSRQRTSEGGRGWQKKKKEKRDVVSVLTTSELREEERPEESSSRVSRSSRTGLSEASEASESRRKSRPTKEHGPNLWSPEEVAIFDRLTKGLARQEIDFNDIVAQLPDPSKRSAKACNSFYWRRVHGREKDRSSQGTLAHHVRPIHQ